MADERELFSILQETSGAGASPHKRQEGDAVSGTNEIGVLPVKDLSGNFQHISARAAGDAPGNGISVLGGLDNAGDQQYFDLRDEGQAPGDQNFPSMVAKDGSGNLQFLTVNASGQLAVDSTPGVPKDARGSALGSIGSYVAVATLTLTASKVYESISTSASCTFPVVWKLEQVDDATTTIVAEGISGPGQFTIDFMPINVSRTAGATGTQQLKLSGKQLHGAASDMHAVVSAMES